MYTIVCAGLALLCLSAGAVAEPVPITSGSNIFDSPVAIRTAPAGDIRLAFISNFYGPSITASIVLGRSSDDGANWTLWSGPGGFDAVQPLRVPTSQAFNPNLIRIDSSQYFLFYAHGVNFDFHLRRSVSSDDATFAAGSVMDMGWSSGIEDQPSVMRSAAGVLTMVYRRPMAEGPSGAGLYLAQSTNQGASWDNQHTLVSSDGILPDLAFRSSDGLYLLSYLVELPGGGYQIRIKSTHDARDWSQPSRELASGILGAARIAVMPDGAFVMVWSRSDGVQADISMSRSMDGTGWSPESTVAGTIDRNDGAPYPLATPSPGVIELYWSAATDGGMNFESQIVRDARIVVLDPVFATGFD